MKKLSSFNILLTMVFLSFNAFAEIPSPQRIDDVLSDSSRKIEDLKNNPLKRLELLKNAFDQGDCSFYFELTHIPKKGKTVVFTGLLFRSTEFLLIQINAKDSSGPMVRILCQNGEIPQTWIIEGKESIKKLESATLFSPIIKGQLFNTIDLSSAFLLWKNPTFEEFKRIKGRFSYLFLEPVPSDLQKNTISCSQVRIVIDAHFNNLLQANYLTENKKILRTLSILSFKKLGDEWIPKTIEIIDEQTRDKSRLTITSAAMNLLLDKSLSLPENLNKEFPSILAKYYQLI